MWLETQKRPVLDLSFFCHFISAKQSSVLPKKSATLDPWSSRSALQNSFSLVSSVRYSQISGMGNTICRKIFRIIII